MSVPIGASKARVEAETIWSLEGDVPDVLVSESSAVLEFRLHRNLFDHKMLILLSLILWGHVKAAMIRMSPIRVRGTLNERPAAFLSKYRELEVMGDDDITLCDVVALELPVSADFYDQIAAKPTTTSAVSKYDIISSCKYYINRDKGIYDSLPYKWRRGNPKKDLYGVLSGAEASPYNRDTILSLAAPVFKSLSRGGQVFCTALDSLLGMQVIQLMIEVSDILDDQRYRLGGAVVIAKAGVESASTELPESYDGTSGQEICVIKAHIDEVILLAMDLDKPIYMSSDLYRSLSMDASLRKDDGDMLVTARRTSVTSQAAYSGSTITPAWDIFNPQSFVAMSMLEKRAVLRASGVRELPRPREGIQALNNALLEVMDDSVRREFLRLSLQGDAAKAKVSETEEQALLRGMGDALEGGRVDEAEALREQFSRRRALKADPTQAAGSYDRFLDQDDWYMEARRRAMAPKK